MKTNKFGDIVIPKDVKIPKRLTSLKIPKKFHFKPDDNLDTTFKKLEGIMDWESKRALKIKNLVLKYQKNKKLRRKK